MAKINKYGFRELKAAFPTEEKCVEYLFDILHNRKCSCGGTYARLAKRRQFQCSKCRFQIAPTAGTIFHKSDTPLSLWFLAILLFSNAKSGYSAKQLERDLNVTYKCAWRMLRLIRKSLANQGDRKLGGNVEVDSALIGGVGRVSKKKKDLSAIYEAKTVVIGAVERGGEVRAKVVKSDGMISHAEFLKDHVTEGTRLLTDSAGAFINSTKAYKREAVVHKNKEYVRGDVFVNGIESFFGHVKRSIQGSHKVISKKHLQSYLDAFVFHYNNRHNDRARFSLLLGTLLTAGR